MRKLVPELCFLQALTQNVLAGRFFSWSEKDQKMEEISFESAAKELSRPTTEMLPSVSLGILDNGFLLWEIAYKTPSGKRLFFVHQLEAAGQRQKFSELETNERKGIKDAIEELMAAN